MVFRMTEQNKAEGFLRRHRLVPNLATYVFKLLRTLWLIIKSPTAFCRQVMNGVPPDKISSPRAFIGTGLVLSTLLSFILSTFDEERDISWFIPFCILAVSDKASFHDAFPTVYQLNMTDSLAEELAASLFSGPPGQSKIARELRNVLQEGVTWNSLERYIAFRDIDFAARFHSLKWATELTGPYDTWWRPAKAVLYWFLIGLLMHLCLPSNGVRIGDGIAAQQYVLFTAVFVVGTPAATFTQYVVSHHFKDRVESSPLVWAGFLTLTLLYLSLAIALRAIAKAYRHSTWVVVGIFCFIATPIASVMANTVGAVSGISYSGVTASKNPSELAAYCSVVFDWLDVITENPRSAIESQYGIGAYIEVSATGNVLVAGLTKNGAAYISGKVSIGDQILKVKKTVNGDWVELNGLKAQSILAILVGEKNTELVLLIRKATAVSDETEQVVLRRKKLNRQQSPLLDVTR